MTDIEIQNLVIEMVDILLEASEEVYEVMKNEISKQAKKAIPQFKNFLKELLEYTDAERKEAGRHEEQS